MTDRSTLRAKIQALKTKYPQEGEPGALGKWTERGRVIAIAEVLALLDAETGTPDSRGYVLPTFVSVVPIDGGGVQLEGHTHEQDWELELDAKGNVLSWAGAETGTTHRCSGCDHRWEGELKGAELCGDCWRKAQPVLFGAETGTAPERVVLNAGEIEELEERTIEWNSVFRERVLSAAGRGTVPAYESTPCPGEDLRDCGPPTAASDRRQGQRQSQSRRQRDDRSD